MLHPKAHVAPFDTFAASEPGSAGYPKNLVILCIRCYTFLVVPVTAWLGIGSRDLEIFEGRTNYELSRLSIFSSWVLARIYGCGVSMLMKKTRFRRSSDQSVSLVFVPCFETNH